MTVGTISIYDSVNGLSTVKDNGTLVALNAVPTIPWTMVNGGVITVSPIGTVNAATVTVTNNGANFGPDTTLGATILGTNGATTKTCGVQEALHYAFTQGFATGNLFPVRLMLWPGNFFMTAGLTFDVPGGSPYIPAIEIFGSGQVVTYVEFSGVTTAISNFFSTLGNVTFHDLTWTCDNNAPLTNFFDLSGYLNVSQLWNSNVAYQFGNLTIDFFHNVPSGEGLITNFINGIMVGNVNFNVTDVPIVFVGCLVGQATNIISFTGVNAGQVTAYGTEWAGNIVLKGSAGVFFVARDSEFLALAANSNFITVPSGAAGQYAHLYDCLISWNTSSGTVAVMNGANGSTDEVIMVGGVTTGTGATVFLSAGVSNLTEPSGYWNVGGMSGIGALSIGTPSLTANPPISGTSYQNTNRDTMILYLPVTLTPTSGAGATVTATLGGFANQYALPPMVVPAGTALDSFQQVYTLVVPAGWFYRFTAVNATLGTITAVQG